MLHTGHVRRERPGDRGFPARRFCRPLGPGVEGLAPETLQHGHSWTSPRGEPPPRSPLPGSLSASAAQQRPPCVPVGALSWRNAGCPRPGAHPPCRAGSPGPGRAGFTACPRPPQLSQTLAWLTAWKTPAVLPVSGKSEYIRLPTGISSPETEPLEPNPLGPRKLLKTRPALLRVASAHSGCASLGVSVTCRPARSWRRPWGCPAWPPTARAQALASSWANGAHFPESTPWTEGDIVNQRNRRPTRLAGSPGAWCSRELCWPASCPSGCPACRRRPRWGRTPQAFGGVSAAWDSAFAAGVGRRREQSRLRPSGLLFPRTFGRPCRWTPAWLLLCRAGEEISSAFGAIRGLRPASFFFISATPHPQAARAGLGPLTPPEARAAQRPSVCLWLFVRRLCCRSAPKRTGAGAGQSRSGSHVFSSTGARVAVGRRLGPVADCVLLIPGRRGRRGRCIRCTCSPGPGGGSWG